MTLSHADAVRSTFESWARDGRGEGMENSHRDIVLQMLDRAGIQAHHHVLDLGCGTGWTVRLLAELAPQGRAYGLDAADEMVHRARAAANAPNVVFSVGPVEALPYADGSLHRVVSMESIYYWTDIAAGLREAHRVLAPGGRFLCAHEYYRENPFTGDWPEALKLDLRLLSGPEYLELLRAAGFEDVRESRLLDRRAPKPEAEFRPGGCFPDYATYLRYRETGAMLIEGVKSGIEPPPEPGARTAPAADAFGV